MTVVAGEKQCEEIVVSSSRQCDNRAFATIEYPDGTKVDVCRLHLAFRATKFKKEQMLAEKPKAKVIADNPAMQDNADSLVKFLTVTHIEKK